MVHCWLCQHGGLALPGLGCFVEGCALYTPRRMVLPMAYERVGLATAIIRGLSALYASRS